MNIAAAGRSAASRAPRRQPTTNIASAGLMGTGLVGAIALDASPPNASAQSFLEGKSTGMTRCVNHILNGRGTLNNVNVHGHLFNCHAMTRGSAKRGNRRYVILSHPQVGLDDYIADFRVDNRNVLLPSTLSIRTDKGLSKRSTPKASLTYLVYAAWVAARKIPGFYSFDGSIYRTYAGFARIASAVPAIKATEWETVAFEILAITIAEYGRSRTRQPDFTTGSAPLQR